MDSPAKQQQETAPENLGDAIAATFDEMEAAENEEVEVSEEENEEVSAETTGEEESPEVEEPEGEQEVSEELQEEIQEAADSDYEEPAPDRWPDDIKEVYNQLPPQARKAMLEGVYKPMQRSYTQATQELAGIRNKFAPMIETMENYRNDFERMGVNPEEVFRTQMAWAAHLSRVGVEQGLRDMSDAYGVSPQQAGQEEQPYLTPTERAQQAQIDALQQQVTGQQQYQQQLTARQQEEQAAAHRNEIQSNLTAFINEKTDDGQPKHPHVEKLASNIAGIIRGGLIRQTDEYGQPVPIRAVLNQAYDMACNLDPSIRTPLQNNARQASRVKAAQKVGVVTKEPAGQDNTDVDEMGMTDFISRTYDTLDRRSA